MGEHVRGDVVVYEREKHIRSARYCFVVLGPAPADLDGTARTLVQMVSTEVLRWSAEGPQAVATVDLTPIAEYGMRAKWCGPDLRGLPYLMLERVGPSKAGRGYFGSNPLYAGTIWESDLQAPVMWELVDIIHARIVELSLERAA